MENAIGIKSIIGVAINTKARSDGKLRIDGSINRKVRKNNKASTGRIVQHHRCFTLYWVHYTPIGTAEMDFYRDLCSSKCGTMTGTIHHLRTILLTSFTSYISEKCCLPLKTTYNPISKAYNG